MSGQLGTLTAAGSGASTTLSGELEGTIEKDDILQLRFQSPGYGSQDGTLTGNDNSIDKVCDYAIAEVKVAGTDDGKITTTAEADFINQQAVIKFTLKDKNQSDAPFSPSSLTINYGEGSININPFPTSNGTGVVYVAIPAMLDGVINMTATKSQNDLRFYEKTGVTFSRGRYYEIGVKMSQLINVSGEEALRQALLNQQFATSIFRLTYTKMSTLTDNGVTLSNGWYVVDKNLTFNKRITISGTVNIILMDNTRLMANNGIYVPINTTLHIWGQSNKLTNPDDMMGIINATAKDKDYSGIGGNQWGICSGILITGGNVIGMGGVYGAGIGSGFCGTMHERKGGFRRRYRE